MISFLAPILAVLFGVLIVLLVSKSKPLNLKLFLAFSGAFLLSTTIFELLPEVYSHLETKKIGVYIMGGILLQILLEFYSKGAEHGHLHHNESKNIFPWFLFISLGIHAFFEGFPLKDHHNINAYLKSDYKAVVEDIFKEEIQATHINRFRDKTDIHRMLISYYAMANKRGILK